MSLGGAICQDNRLGTETQINNKPNYITKIKPMSHKRK